jgi:hypothetical protein
MSSLPNRLTETRDPSSGISPAVTFPPVFAIDEIARPRSSVAVRQRIPEPITLPRTQQAASPGTAEQAPEVAFQTRLVSIPTGAATADPAKIFPIVSNLRPLPATAAMPPVSKMMPEKHPDSMSGAGVETSAAPKPTGRSAGRPEEPEAKTPDDRQPHLAQHNVRPERAETRNVVPESPATPVSEPRAAAPERIAPAAPKAPAEPVSRPEIQEPQKPVAPPLRDIRLDLHNGERRVEVRLQERAGDVHIAVRTPDAHLSGQLRDNFPDLASRLEQSAGYRAEPLHESGPVESDARRPVNESSGTAQQGGSGEGQDRGGQPGQRHPRQQAFDETPHRNHRQKGMDFAWYMPSQHTA